MVYHLMVLTDKMITNVDYLSVYKITMVKAKVKYVCPLTL